jgi:transcriptional repressor NrdR
MWCPFCNHENTRVVDSRLTRDGMQTREAFSEQKLREGMLRALEKRPVETRQVERTIRSLLREISTVEDSEIPSSLVGEWVMRELSKLDQVAYVRFASVYKRFEDVQAFRDVIESLEREAPADEDNPQISLLDKK